MTRANQIIQAVYDSQGIAVDLIQSDRRTRPIVEARFLAAYFLRDRLGLTLEAIADLLGRDFRAIQKGIEKVDDLKTRDQEMKKKFERAKRAIDGKG